MSRVELGGEKLGRITGVPGPGLVCGWGIKKKKMGKRGLRGKGRWTIRKKGPGKKIPAGSGLPQQV